MRQVMTPHPDLESALVDRDESPWFASLNGTWSFRLFDSPEAVTASSLSKESSRDRALAVPGNWTVQDVGDLPHYTNVQMPFPGPPPQLPASNPTGVYRRSFTIGRGWKRHRVVLHVGGAESVHAVYLNDRFVGYGTDSRLDRKSTRLNSSHRT